MGTQFLKKEFKKEYAMDVVVSSTNILYRSDKVERQKHAQCWVSLEFTWKCYNKKWIPNGIKNTVYKNILLYY